MRSAENRSEDRVEQAGADILSIAETSVLVGADDPPCGEPWRHPAWPLCRGLGALGFGFIHLRGADEYAEDFSAMMDGFPFTQGPALRPHDVPPEEAPPCEIVLHLGCDSEGREACARLALSRSAHFASVSWGSTWVAMGSLEGTLRDVFVPDADAVVDQEPLAPIARIAAGLALQEALIVAGRLGAAAPPDPLVWFDAAAETRMHRGEGAAWPPVCIEPSIIEVIGAGAVGTHLLESLAPLLGPGCELRIFDFDEIGPENLAMQAAFSPEDVGRPKAAVMAEKLAPMCDPALRIRPMVMRYEERPPTLSAPSLRVACPDSFAARKQANDASIADGVPLVEAGSSPLAAQQRTYLPGRTACLEHRIPKLLERAADERNRAPCSQEHAFTLPGTNMICGGILAAEALRALQPEDFGWPSAGTVVYDARFPERFGLIEMRPPCSHPA